MSALLTPPVTPGEAMAAARGGPAEFVREQHRRLFDLLRAVAGARDPDERIELAASLGDELYHLVALECGALQAAFAARLPAFFDVAGEAHARRTRLAVLADEVASAAIDGLITRALVDEIFSAAADHVAVTVRELLPLLEALPAAQAASLEGRLRDAKERMAEH